MFTAIFAIKQLTMKNLLYCFSVLFLFTAGCKNKTSIIKKSAKDSSASLIIGDPFDYGVENILLFPIGSNYNPIVYENPDEFENDLETNKKVMLAFDLNVSTLNDRYANIEYINNDVQTFDINNILFYNLLTGASYPLLKDTLHILSFALHKEFANPLIFYRVVARDYNLDSLFTDDDPVMLYVSDLHGQNLHKITPPDEKFIDYFYYKSVNTILIKTIVDNNQDKLFTPADETNFLQMKLDAPEKATEIFDAQTKDLLRKTQ